MAVAEPSILEVGPGTVRVLGRPPSPVSAATAAALQALDDPVALVGGQPMPVAQLWRTLIAELLGAPAGPLTLLHPSWWPQPRVDRVAAAAAVPTGPVVAMSRAEVLARWWAGSAVVVEIADGLVAVSGGGPVRLLDRGDIAGIAAAATHPVDGATVLIDAPDEIADAAQTAAQIAEVLQRNAISVQRVDIGACFPEAAGRAPGRSRRPSAGLAAALCAVAVVAAVALGAAAWPRELPGPGRVPLVEGRVAVDVPPGWPVRRVTEGPGSRRVEVGPPGGAGPVLHITAAYAPGSTLAGAAEVLRHAAAAGPAGVFVDFRTAEVAGRPALTYREIRPARVVVWSVLLDGSMRIGIGCQSPPGRQEAMHAVCEQAVRSAHELSGTEVPRPTSN